MENPVISSPDTKEYGLHEIIDMNNRQVLYLQYFPSEHKVDKFTILPIKQIPLLGELGLYAGYFPNHKFNFPNIDDSLGKYLEQMEEKILDEKHELLEKPDKTEKRSSLITTLERICNDAVNKHYAYCDSLLKGDDRIDYFASENVSIYIVEYIPRITKTIKILMSDLIYSDRLNPKVFTDKETNQTYKQIADKILIGKSDDKSDDFFRLVSLGLSVVKQKKKEEKIKIIAPRRHSSQPMIFNEHGQVNLTAETTTGEN